MVSGLLGCPGDAAQAVRRRKKEDMKQKDSMKRLLILALSLIGLCVLTAFYAYMWYNYFYNHIFWKTGNRFNVNGHILVVGIYFALLFFFSNTLCCIK